MNFNVTKVTGEFSMKPQEYFARFDPEIWDLSNPMTPMNEIKRAPLDCSVVEWIEKPTVGFFTEHTHDGTMTFTLMAVNVVCESAAAYMKENSGPWECSRVIVAHKYGEGMMYPVSELVGLTMRPADQPDGSQL